MPVRMVPRSVDIGLRGRMDRGENRYTSTFHENPEFSEVMGMLRKLQGSIDFGNAPADEREELATDVADIMDELFEIMKRLPDEE